MSNDPKGFNPFAKKSGYNPKSCNSLAKPFYRPIEAAIRWCGLIEEEPSILSRLGDSLIPSPTLFPHYPCLGPNTDRIIHATQNGDLAYSRDGRRVGAGEHVAPARLTVQHTDLKEWMAKHYPDQKPDFLFDEIERQTHQAINADSFRALQADCEAKRAELEAALAELEQEKERAGVIVEERNALRKERDSLLAKAKALGTTERNTLLTIIAGLCHHATIDHQVHGAAAKVSRITEHAGAPVSPDTLERVLVLIPAAVESRTK